MEKFIENNNLIKKSRAYGKCGEAGVMGIRLFYYAFRS
jgi:hypothetical protein